jgi:hypothetical protein
LFFRILSTFPILAILALTACTQNLDSFIESYSNDKENPGKISSLELSSIGDDLTTSPEISFTDATDDLSGVANYEIRILKASDDSLVSTWTKANEKGQVSNTNLEIGTAYYLEVRAKDRSGKYGEAVASEHFLPASLLCVGDLITNSPYASGTGTKTDPFQICTADQFIAIAARPGDFDSYFSIAADLEFSGKSFDGIGSETSPFRGNIKGNNRTLHNVSINRASGDYVGVFNSIDLARIDSLNLKSANIVAANSQNVGGLAGYCHRSRVYNTKIKASTISANQWVGGLIGWSYNCNVDSLDIDATVNGTVQITGGAIGYSERTLLTHSKGNVIVNGATNSRYTGGIIGFEGYGTDLVFSHFTGTITGHREVGGIIGAQGDNLLVVSSSFKGSVTGIEEVGCFFGAIFDVPNKIYKSSCEADIEGNIYVGGVAGGFYAHTYIYDSYFKGTITSSGASPDSFGGVAGEGGDGMDLVRSYIKANIDTDAKNVGGFWGSISWDSDDFFIKDSFVDSAVKGDDTDLSVSKITAYVDGPSVTTSNSFYNYNSACTNTTAGVCSNIHNFNPAAGPSFFTDITSSVYMNWDFSNTWKIYDNSYPVLEDTLKSLPGISHSCNNTKAYFANEYSCGFTLTDTTPDDYNSVILTENNECDWISVYRNEFVGYPNFDSGVSKCTVEYYVKDAHNKTQVESFDIELQRGLSISPTDFDTGIFNFGSIAASGGTITQTFTLTNHLADPITGISVSSIPSANFFFQGGGAYPGSTGTCGTSLAAGATCTVVLEFDPTAVTNYQRNSYWSYTLSSSEVINFSFRFTGEGL